jgi:hypothetical protein
MKRLILAGLVVLLVGSTATAATITAGDAGIFTENTSGNVWTVTVSPTSSGETGQSMNFYLSIGNPLDGTPGTAVRPDIVGITFDETGYLFDGGFGTPWAPPPPAGPPWIDAYGGAFIIPAQTITAGMGIARVVFDTNDPGKWELKLTSLDGSSSTTLDAGAALVHGTVTVGAIPEPAMVVQLLGLLGTGGLGLMLRWRRRRAA